MLGLWDSGLGGLTVAADIARLMPKLSFLYRADHMHAPYGARSRADILERMTHELDVMFHAGCNLVVFACNTASVAALRDIQQSWLPQHWPTEKTRKNVLGVVVPVVEALADTLPTHDILPTAPTVQIFATDHTVRSQVFVTEIYKRAPGLRVMQTACPELVPAIERGAGENELHSLVQQYAAVAAQNCPHPDYVILGCTHYALIKDKFAKVLPHTTPILDQPHTLAEKLHSYLHRHPEYEMDYSGKHIFTTTGDVMTVNPAAQRYFDQLGLVGKFMSSPLDIAA
jgi:glutamate racemase